ncbi:hypothetical protein CH378_17950 [Leptospira kmetyi]|uniref:Uncharacterized protein n=1 Tax=Leptospira kmetyi TaxID=408139 RepID=A0ABX4N798_9LEPT|nr:hypothetical protein CH378_17950 [Leptospira kmetyi]
MAVRSASEIAGNVAKGESGEGVGIPRSAGVYGVTLELNKNGNLPEPAFMQLTAPNKNIRRIKYFKI